MMPSTSTLRRSLEEPRLAFAPSAIRHTSPKHSDHTLSYCEWLAETSTASWVSDRALQ
jgi:hypothetical protein